jgi:membrane protease YdiL (CAAX protease family)
LLLFFVIAYAWTWLINLPRVLDSSGVISLPGGVSFALGQLSMFGPSLSGFYLAYRYSGGDGVRRLWRRGWDLGFRKVWLLPAILLMPLLGYATVLIMQAAGLTVEWQYGVSGPMIALVGVAIFLTNGLGEEFGWRGFALDRLQSRWNALLSSLVLGVLWGLWHLPLHFIDGTTQAAIPVWQFVLQQAALAVLFTWLHNNAAGSVFIALMFHTFGNIAGAVFPTWTQNAGRFINFGLLLVVIGVVLAVWGPKTMTRRGSIRA